MVEFMKNVGVGILSIGVVLFLAWLFHSNIFNYLIAAVVVIAILWYLGKAMRWLINNE